ncbi:MAG: ATP phosphoribosyltransferase [Thaumarchaeota archaeon]|nr:ATP phosphoribosyltransferase [Nitrososphaerota archaeon]
MKKVRWAIPKGSLEQDTISLINSSILKIRGSERSYRPSINDEEIMVKILRPQEIPKYVEQGLYDIGITGKDWIIETGAKVQTLVDLEYGKVKIVLAGPLELKKDPNLILKDYNKKGKKLRVATEYPNITSAFFQNLQYYKEVYGNARPLIITPWYTFGENENVEIYLSFGATEAKPPEEADLVVDVTETGTTLRENGLVEIAEIMRSSAVLIANKDSINDNSKKEKILDIIALLKGVVEARKKLHIFLNVSEENLQKLLNALPALKSPTISKLSIEGWYAVNTVIDEDEFLKVLPMLRKYAQGLVVHKPSSIMPLEEIGVA